MRATSSSTAVWSGLGFAVLLSLVACFAFAPIFAVDFFWHLELGKLIAETHAVPQTDMFSAVHPERSFVQFQWLWELVVYGSYRLGGFTGVRLFQVLTLTGSFVLLLRASARLLHSHLLAFVLCALALVLFEDRFQTRPSATVLGFIALVLPFLVEEELRARRLAWLFVVATGCLWSNVHGGESLLWPLSLGALALGAGLQRRLAKGSRAAFLRDTKLFVAACLGVLLSPAFVATDWSRAIVPQLATGNKEWRPSYTMLENGVSASHLLIALGPTVICVFYVLEQARRTGDNRLRSAPWGEWLLAGGLLMLAQLMVRNAFLAVVPLCFMLRRLPRPRAPRVDRLVASLGALLLFVAFHDHVIVGYGGVAEARDIVVEDLAPNAFPVELAAFMREAGIEGPILNDGRWGGYLIWELWPACHVFVDTRQDLTEEMWPVFLASQHAQQREQALELAFTRWKVELAVFRGPTFAGMTAPPTWQLLYKAGDQELYQRRGGAHAGQNLALTLAWQQRQTGRDTPPDEVARVATELGAKHWLAAPHQLRVARRAQRLMESPHAADISDGLRLSSQLSFDSGDYPDALRTLERLLRYEPNDVAVLYRYALASHAVDDEPRTRWALHKLTMQLDSLSAAQRGRLAVLASQLRAERP